MLRATTKHAVSAFGYCVVTFETVTCFRRVSDRYRRIEFWFIQTGSTRCVFHVFLHAVRGEPGWVVMVVVFLQATSHGMKDERPAINTIASVVCRQLHATAERGEPARFIQGMNKQKQGLQTPGNPRSHRRNGRAAQGSLPLLRPRKQSRCIDGTTFG